jgi:hypothetical protein
MARKGDPRHIEDPDVEIGASVKAKELRFRSKPETDVEVHGEVREPEARAEAETASGSERHNLPDEVEPGVTYKDVRVRWSAEARIVDPANLSSEEDNERSGEGEKHEEQDEG